MDGNRSVTSLGWAACVLLGCVCIAGCAEQSGSSPSEAVQPAAPGPPPPPPVARKDTLPYPRGGAGDKANDQKESPEPERVEAQVGVGVKGRRLEDERLVQMIVTPAVSLFRTRERVVFEMQIPKAMQLYEALNGKKPASEKEYFEQIIKANQIELPKLPPGQRYVYDPEKAVLMVEKPAN